MRKLTPAQINERISSYRDFASDVTAREIGLEVLGIMDNRQLDGYVRLRTTHEVAPVIQLPLQVGRAACADAEVSLGNVS